MVLAVLRVVAVVALPVQEPELPEIFPVIFAEPGKNGINPNKLQAKIKSDLVKFRRDQRILVETDKTSNSYLTPKED